MGNDFWTHLGVFGEWTFSLFFSLFCLEKITLFSFIQLHKSSPLCFRSKCEGISLGFRDAMATWFIFHAWFILRALTPEVTKWPSDIRSEGLDFSYCLWPVKAETQLSVSCSIPLRQWSHVFLHSEFFLTAHHLLKPWHLQEMIRYLHFLIDNNVLFFFIKVSSRERWNLVFNQAAKRSRLYVTKQFDVYRAI